MELFTERHAAKITGELSCLDRVVISGTLPGLCYADGMSRYLRFNGIRIFDYARWAEPLRDQIRQNAQALAEEAGVSIEYLRNSNLRKESLVHEILKKRGNHQGLVCIFSAMEGCSSYKPWHDKPSGRTFLKGDTGKCLHYYFYFIDPELGLCYLRVPTWAPFRLQFYFNGHGALEAVMRKRQIEARMLDNAFVHVADWLQAQRLAEQLKPEALHRKLDHYARLFCPPVALFDSGYHWSLMQVEYATDIVFRRQQELSPIYESLVRTAVHAVKAENVATFLGRKLCGQYRDELGNDFQTRIQGTRIKHRMAKAAIKMYDKHGLILRIETTVNDVSFFKHHRRVEHRNGSWQMKTAPLKKSIYSLPALVDLMCASNRRYLEFISTLDDPSSGLKDLEKIALAVRKGKRSLRGFNLFAGDDLDVFQTLLRGEYNISGFQNKDLAQRLHKGGRQVSWLLKRLRCHGLIKKVGHCYKYYLTALGRRVTATAVRLREMAVIPSLCAAHSRA
ncbi:MAG: MarR family transcriptional regulator [Desulfobacterales bacterium]|nr:MarR family transcriptional regulator [Desulfobacterales bacterium]